MSDDHPEKAHPDDEHFRRRMHYEYGTIGPKHEADLLEGLCEGFVRANQVQIRADPAFYPCCLGCGSYVYVPPQSCRVYDWRRGQTVDPNCQAVRGAYPLHTIKQGTCIDLACMLAAVMREKGGDRKAHVIIDYQLDADGNRIEGQYHAMVRKGSGEIVDPVTKVKQARGAPPLACGCGEG